MKNLCLLFLVGLATGFISEKLFVSSQTPFSTTDDLYIEGRSSGDLPIDDEDGEDDGSGSGSGDYGLGFLDNEEILRRLLNSSTETLPLQPQPTADSPHNPPTTAADSQDSATTVKVSETTPFIFPDGSDRHEEMPGDETTRSNVEESVDTTTSSLGSASATSEADSSMVTEDADMDNSLDRLGMTTSKDEVLITDLENEIIPRDGRGSRLYEMDPPAERSSDSLWERTDVLAAVIACGVVGLLCAIFLLSLLAYRMKKKDEGSYDLGDTKLSATAYHKAPTKEFYA